LLLHRSPVFNRRNTPGSSPTPSSSSSSEVPRRMRNLEELYDATQVVATQFLTYILINLQKKSKIAKNNEKPQKNCILIYLHFF
jgi:hypothetical protein